MNNTISFGDIFRAVCRKSWVIAASAGTMAACAVVYLHVATPEYTAEMTVVPVTSSSAPIGGQLSGLASLAGVNLSGKGEQIDLYREALQSRIVALEIAKDQKLMRQLYPEEWNAQTSTWQHPPSARHSLKSAIYWVLGMPTPQWREPDADRVERLLDDKVNVSFGPDSPITAVSVHHPKPQVALALLVKLHETADAVLRQRAVARTGEYTTYLQGKLAEVMVADYRAALVQALADQEKQRMVAMSGLAFAAEPFAPEKVSHMPTKPNGPIVLIAAILAGFIIGVTIVLYRSFFAAPATPREVRAKVVPAE